MIMVVCLKADVGILIMILDMILLETYVDYDFE